MRFAPSLAAGQTGFALKEMASHGRPENPSSPTVDLCAKPNLELISKDQLQYAWIASGSYLSEVRRSKWCVRIRQVRMVEHIECFSAKFNALSLGDAKVLVERHIEVNELWSGYDAGSSVADESSRRRYKSCGVEPCGDRLRTAIDRLPRHHIRTGWESRIGTADSRGKRGSAANRGQV